MIAHIAACIADRAREDAEVAAWVARWPGTCASCGGEGGHASGGSYFEPPDYSPCGCVADDSRCARCGSDGLAFDEESGISVCQWCAWTDDPVVQHEHWALLVAPVPDDGPCICFEISEWAYYRRAGDAEPEWVTAALADHADRDALGVHDGEETKWARGAHGASAGHVR